MSAISKAMEEAQKLDLMVINLFGGPGTGKSTTAAYLFAKYKSGGINTEYVQEFAKDKTWEENETALKCQPYIAGKQFWRLARLRGKVDIAITDSPLLTSLLYPTFGVNSDWEKGIVNQFNLFDNVNIFLVRNTDVHPYNPKGRSQTEAEAKSIDVLTKNMLNKYDIPFYTVEVGALEQTYYEIKKAIFAHTYGISPSSAGMDYGIIDYGG